ncbi:ABC transporter related protein [Coriobacterium glomerans PW2]|uniref:ABC transporter related protein n=1 Tax=Coriobacterium glomerans (strain ATCC 49209 / DSM 20642 / JCM 10262 / PW2) TaxID=700015 RepID=F2NAI9_CORGP|nr:ATP-binding cassette domain-containing protein [Coriobacterium glomerans]AEB06516.1 ABC transporter related protein [Coriobacterium glomerans PW2]
MLEMSCVSKTIKGVEVVRDVSLSAAPGRVVGLSGVNGSGKTMLMRMACGLIRPSAGEVAVDGKRLWRDIAFPPSVGLLIEGPAFLDNRSGTANLELLASIRRSVDAAGVRAAIARVGLDPQDRRRYRKYSLGMKQRLGIAAAIMEAPDLLVLDEPTNALDVAGVEMLKRIVAQERSRGACVLVSCHDAGVLREMSDEVIYLAEGAVERRETIAVRS